LRVRVHPPRQSPAKTDLSLTYGGIGTGTTAASLTTALHYLTRMPKLWKTLQNDLEGICGSEQRPDVAKLESVPLLESCVKECVRLAVPIRGRHPRVAPSEGFTYMNQHFAAGVGHLLPNQGHLNKLIDSRRPSSAATQSIIVWTQTYFRNHTSSNPSDGSWKIQRPCKNTTSLSHAGQESVSV
jgi:hypothetical protein